MVLALVALSAQAAFLVAGVPAHAAYPGTNGQIAFTSNRDESHYEIYKMGADGTNVTRLTNNTALDDMPAWSPPGTQIAFQTNRDGNYEIYSMNADGTRQTNLTNNGADDFEPTWSADGSKIAFSTNRDGNFEIYAMNADGSAPTRLTNIAATDKSAAWSPDGTKIAFTTNRDGNNEIYTMNSDGTLPTRLTNNAADDQAPEWSPDGKKIAFETNRDGGYEIYTMNSNGTGLTRLTNNSVLDAQPGWSPDGTKITFHSDRNGDGNAEIYTMNAADGSAQTRITPDSADDLVPDWERITGYPRPKGATPYRVPLVPAYQPCAGLSSNSTHGAPLSYPSCKPPVQASSFLTVGTPDANGAAANAVGSVLFRAITGDVRIGVSTTDVRCKNYVFPPSPCDPSNANDAVGPDYTGELDLEPGIRITDRRNGTGESDPGTVVDITPRSLFGGKIAVPCAATASTTIGSTCSLSTTFDALLPGAVTSGARTIWQVNQVRLLDGGSGGNAGASDATLFEDQGLFVP